MFRKVCITFFSLFATVGVFVALGQSPVQPDENGRASVDFRADQMSRIKVGDSSALCLVGHVVFFHNGAVIMCDSAVRYSERQMDCYRNVVVNKDSTFIYGDKADYNGDLNEARIYSPLIKMVDKDATLYTRNFTFNTLDNIGRYYGGGTLSQQDNLMESDEGYYYADLREVVGVHNVEMSNPEYMIRSDSVSYNLDSEIASFDTRSYIWNDRDEFLTAQKGTYNSKQQRYVFTNDSYIMTPDQEAWADTIVYEQPTQNALMLNKVQMFDRKQRTFAFGDYARYWGDKEQALLTRNPSLAGYEEDGSDTVFMRSDTIYLYTVNRFKNDSIPEVPEISAVQDSVDVAGVAIEGDSIVTDQPIAGGFRPDAGADSVSVAVEKETVAVSTAEASGQRSADSLGQESGGAELSTGVSPEPVSNSVREEVPSEEVSGSPVAAEPEKSADEKPVSEDAAVSQDKGSEALSSDSTAVTESLAEDSTGLIVAEGDSLVVAQDSISPEKALKIAEKARKQAERDSLRRQKDERVMEKIRALRKKAEEAERKAMQQELNRERKYLARRFLKGKATAEDSLALHRVDSLQLLLTPDSVSLDDAASPDSTKPGGDSTAVEQPQPEAWVAQVDSTTLTPADSLVRTVHGYRNVRIYRTDFQAVCDSIVGFTADSTIHMYINPVLWNEENQITAQVVDIFTRNQSLERALFTGDPLMSSRVDTAHFNQVSGKEIESFFDKGNIYRTDVKGNGRTYYYMEEGDSTDRHISGFLVAECADITFEFADQELSTIIYRGQPAYTIYPMDKIPDTQSQLMPGFVWEAERRPTREQVFDRVIRPSERERYEKLERPDYPITRAIDKQREALTRSGWIDRVDRVLTPEAEEFVRSLSY